MKILLLYSIIFWNIPIFYKTMPPEYKPIYQELKDLEKIIINIARKDYPKIPNEYWDSFDTLEDVIQKNIRTPHIVTQQIERPIIKDKMSLEELEMYATKYFIYECNRLSINQNKINFNLGQLPDNVAGLTKGANFTIAPNTSEKQNMALLDVINIQPYTIILETQPTITIDVIKLAKNDITIRFIEHAIKHELIHACEAHGSKAGLLSSIIMYYYGENELKSDHYKELLKYYNKALELQADIVPALLEHNYHVKLANIYPIHYKRLSDFHADGNIIHFWLQKIEIANLKSLLKKRIFSLIF